MSANERDRVDPIVEFIREFDPRVDTSKTAVFLRLRRAAHHIETEVRRRLAPQGFELWEIELLAGLFRRGGRLSMGQIMDAAQLTSGAITNRVGRLEKSGCVERTFDPQDRRLVMVELTRAGEKRARDLIATYNRVEEEVARTLDPETLARLEGDLRRFLLATEGPEVTGSRTARKKNSMRREATQLGS